MLDLRFLCPQKLQGMLEQIADLQSLMDLGLVAPLRMLTLGTAAPSLPLFQLQDRQLVRPFLEQMPQLT